MSTVWYGTIFLARHEPTASKKAAVVPDGDEIESSFVLNDENEEVATPFMNDDTTLTAKHGLERTEKEIEPAVASEDEDTTHVMHNDTTVTADQGLEVTMVNDSGTEAAPTIHDNDPVEERADAQEADTFANLIQIIKMQLRRRFEDVSGQYTDRPWLTKKLCYFL